MFTRLFFGIFLSICLAFTLGIFLLDSIYTAGVKKDELFNTRGIKQVVLADVRGAAEKNVRLDYWSHRFSYQFSLKKLSDLPLFPAQKMELTNNDVLVSVVSGWTVDDISLYYYDKICDCVLVMDKNYGSHGDYQTYVQNLLLIVISVLAFIVFYYVNSHKKQVNKLVKVHQQYGLGKFEARADVLVPKPYALLAQNFNQMTDQIELLQQEHKNLINGVSHDLKTPIARIRFALDLTHHCHTVADYQARLQDMDLDLDELDTLVNEWLFYAELNGKPMPIIKESVNFAELIELTARKIKTVYPDIQLRLNLQEGYIKAEPRLINRAIENLIVNSFKFSKSQVLISVEFTNEHITFRIEDDGIGVDDQQKTQITQPFVKLDDSRNSAGFGLGLAIVKSILDKHSAELQIQASPLGGACFSLILPAESLIPSRITH
ncbi:MAG: two-component system OmpR family sensor kinase [Alteromonadaceae bacterium]|jgi:two-component system OmpR family sensor kinase